MVFPSNGRRLPSTPSATACILAAAVFAVAVLLTLIDSMESHRLEEVRIASLRSVVDSATAIAADYAGA
jgi:hypothetical protein